jgi:hypothetical protein
MDIDECIFKSAIIVLTGLSVMDFVDGYLLADRKN